MGSNWFLLALQWVGPRSSELQSGAPLAQHFSALDYNLPGLSSNAHTLGSFSLVIFLFIAFFKTDKTHWTASRGVKAELDEQRPPAPPLPALRCRH